MGIPSIDSRHRHDIPYTPPELVSPGALLYPPRPSEDRMLNPVAPISPPMSNYDPTPKIEVSSGKNSDESQPLGDATRTAPKQQLPSLSSLFGPPATVRPLHSPLSDRPPSHTTASSSHDRPFGSSSSLDRSFSSSSYFPSTASSSVSQPRSAYEPRFEDRLPFAHLSRPFPGPLSPSTRDPEHRRPTTASESSYASRWPPHHEASRDDYALGNQEQGSYRPSPDRLPPTVGPRHDSDMGSGYGERRAPQSANPQPPSTPGNIVTPEGVTVKDGLGPKIWTGTHFLPRFVRAAEVPGEGMCYFYDDGSHCKTVIDGEAVNAHWGVTKAGKPRKRLAIACVTCREKKIKCDPDYPRCVQCEKFGRVCKFKNAPRGGNNTSPSTPPAEVDDSRQLPPLLRPPPDHPRPSSHSSESVSPRTALRPASPEPLGHVTKRIRVDFERFMPTGSQRSPMLPAPDTTPPAVSWRQHRELPRIHEDVLCRVWQTDPYVSDPQSVLSTISSFFVHADATALRFLPEKVFKEYIQSNAHRKSPEDLMLVYSILALGISLSGGPKTVAHEYSEVARYATHRTALSLQLVQTRILLSLYYLQVSRPSDANDMSSAAISTATCFQLNMEFEHPNNSGSSMKYPFNMSFAGFSECRRRTFWSCFVLERLNGLFPSRVSIINKEDVFLRLPRDVRSFENQLEIVATPSFEPEFSASQNRHSELHIMGCLVQVVTLYGDVMTTIYRVAHRGGNYNFDFSRFERDMLSRLQDWNTSLTAHLTFTPLNLQRVPSEEKGSFILMHLVYHLTMIKLHRHIHPRFLTSEQRYNHSLAAHEQAEKLLDVVCSIAKESSIGRSMMPPPFMSHAILEVVDVLSAEGPLSALSRLVDRLATARSVIEILATVWDEATGHRVTMDHRLDKLANLRDQGSPAEAAVSNLPIPGIRVFHNKIEIKEKKLPAGACWQMTDALEARFPKDMDTVYTSLAPLSLGGN